MSKDEDQDRGWFDHSRPPDWGSGLVRIKGNLGNVWRVFLQEEDREVLYLWHWCNHSIWVANGGQETRTSWGLAGTGRHTQTWSADGKLTLTPSVYWSDCCGMHGFIVNDTWVAAG